MSENSFPPHQFSNDLSQNITRPSNPLIKALKKHSKILCETIKDIQSDIEAKCDEVQERCQKTKTDPVIQGSVSKGSVDDCMDEIRILTEIMEEAKQSMNVAKILLSLASGGLNENEQDE